jgi:hypothetical protein
MLNRKMWTERTEASGEPDDTHDSRPARCRSPVVPEGKCTSRAETGGTARISTAGTTGTPRKRRFQGIFGSAAVILRS